MGMGMAVARGDGVMSVVPAYSFMNMHSLVLIFKGSDVLYFEIYL